MGRQRREFSPEYKDEAVKLVINTGRTVAVVARELGIQESTLGRWVNSFKGRQEAGDGALSETERAELARLRKENSELKLDRAFLKKRRSSSPRKHRIRIPSVRADARGEEQPHDQQDGAVVGGLEVGVLCLGQASAVAGGGAQGADRGQGGLVSW
jgi:transposase